MLKITFAFYKSYFDFYIIVFKSHLVLDPSQVCVPWVCQGNTCNIRWCLMYLTAGKGSSWEKWSCLSITLLLHVHMKIPVQLSDFAFTFHFHALEKEMATHSSVLAWRVPGTGEPGGLASMGSHRVGHDWSELAVSRDIFGCDNLWEEGGLPLTSSGLGQGFSSTSHMVQDSPHNKKWCRPKHQ